MTAATMSTSGIGTGAAMAGLAMASVGLWTLRVAVTARGKKVLGACVAALEAIVFAVAFTNLASSLTAPVPVLGYAIGVASGTLLGLYLDERVAGGESEVRIVLPGRDARVSRELHRFGWPATSLFAEGPSGQVTVVFVAVDDTRVHEITRLLAGVAPAAFWTVQQLRRVHATSLPAGCIQVGGHAGFRLARGHSSARRPQLSRPCGPPTPAVAAR